MFLRDGAHDMHLVQTTPRSIVVLDVASLAEVQVVRAEKRVGLVDRVAGAVDVDAQVAAAIVAVPVTHRDVARALLVA